MCIQNIPFCIITRCKIWDLVWRANAKLGSISWPPDTPPHKFHPNFIIARMSWDVGALWHNQIYGTVSQGPLHRELRSHGWGPMWRNSHTHTQLYSCSIQEKWSWLKEAIASDAVTMLAPQGALRAVTVPHYWSAAAATFLRFSLQPQEHDQCLYFSCQSRELRWMKFFRKCQLRRRKTYWLATNPSAPETCKI